MRAPGSDFLRALAEVGQCKACSTSTANWTRVGLVSSGSSESRLRPTLLTGPLVLRPEEACRWVGLDRPESFVVPDRLIKALVEGPGLESKGEVTAS